MNFRVGRAGIGALRGRWTAIGAMLAIAIMMVMGGGVPGVVTTVAMAVAGLVLLACLVPAGGASSLRDQPLLLRIGLLCVALLPLLQVLPLPPSWWQALPGQALRLQTLTLAGLADSWQPLSVTPLYTAGAAVVGIAFAALMALLLALSPADFRRVAWFVMAIFVANILVGLLQVSTGGQTFRLHRAADYGAFLGFYANKNHAALMLAASLPVAAYLLGSRDHAQGSRTWLLMYAGVVMVALVTTNSRAGIALGLLTVAVLGALYVRRVKPVYAIAGAAVLVIAAIVVSTTSAFDVVFSRFGNVGEDLRWQYLEASRPIIARYWLLGSGIGSFSTLYTVGEGLALLKPTYVNQLHNEYPQLLLETGVPGVVILVALTGAILWRGVAIWRAGNAELRLPLICGGLILALIAFHSVVDYPLRRPATLPILALAIALAIRGDLTASTGFARRRPRS